MQMLMFIVPAIIGCTIVLVSMVLGNEELRRLLLAIVMLLWALVRWPFTALAGMFRRG
jgi:hypothetical protein